MGKGSKASLGCLFWIAIILLAVVLFLFNQQAIMDLIQRLQNNDGRRTTVTLTSPSPSPTAPPREENPLVTLPPSASPGPSPAAGKTATGSTPAPETVKPTQSPSPSPALVKASVRTSTLYFIATNVEDTFELKSVARRVTHDNAPLTGTLRALLTGPTAAEKKTGVVSLIPSRTQLQAVAVKGDTAIISFSEDFRFNENGVPGLLAQVKQIVYTATDFKNIARVQILIDGKKVNYLAQEGMFVGAPLTRSSF